MNVELLEKIKKHILEEPKRLNMDQWVLKPSLEDPLVPACGTIGCIAGWAVLLAQPELIKKRWHELNHEDICLLQHPRMAAQILLDLDNEQVEGLFYRNGWPDKFKYALFTAGSSQVRAEVTAARIDSFIASEGKNSGG